MRITISPQPAILKQNDFLQSAQTKHNIDVGAGTLRTSRSLSSRSICRSEQSSSPSSSYSPTLPTSGLGVRFEMPEPLPPSYAMSIDSREASTATFRRDGGERRSLAPITPGHQPTSVEQLSDGVYYCKLENAYAANLRKDGRSYHLGTFSGPKGSPIAIKLAREKYSQGVARARFEDLLRQDRAHLMSNKPWEKKAGVSGKTQGKVAGRFAFIDEIGYLGAPQQKYLGFSEERRQAAMEAPPPRRISTSKCTSSQSRRVGTILHSPIRKYTQYDLIRGNAPTHRKKKSVCYSRDALCDVPPKYVLE